MPKVSVVTIPEEIIPVPPMRPPVEPVLEERPGFPWREFLACLTSGLKALFHQHNLPVNMLALLLGRVSLMGEVAPFALAFFAAIASLARERAAAVGLWAVVGVLSAGFYQEAVVYVLSMLLYWRLSDKLTRLERKAQAVPLFMFGCVLLSGMALTPWRESTLYSMMLVVFDATLCMVLAFVFQYGAPLFLSNKLKVLQAGTETLICGIIILAVAVAGLGNLTIYDYSLRNIAGCLITMTIALTGGSGLGASVGVVTGLVIGLSDGNAASAIAMYALAGMLGGMFSGKGKAAVVLGFMLGSAIAVLYFGQASQLLLALVETTAAAVAFMLVPTAKLSQWRESCMDDADGSEAAQQAVSTAVNKLNNIARIFIDLAGTFNAAGVKEQVSYNDQIRESQLAQLLSAVGDKVCGPCERRSECWDRDFYQTYQSIVDMLALAEAGKLKPSAMPDIIKNWCVKRSPLVDVITQVAENNRAHWYWHKKLAEYRQLTAEQMKATGTIIGNLALEIKKAPQCDKEIAGLLTERAAVLNCSLSGVRVTGERGKVIVEAQKTPCGGTRECVNTILPLTANILQEKMLMHADCGNKVGNKNCHLTMELAERYHVETGIATIAKEADGVCGDTCIAQQVSRGKTALMLSDGMGSGEQAAAGSRQAVEFLKQLLSAGFDVDTAVKTVNSLLLIKMPDNTFATIDMAVVDTFSGETEFLKIGSAPSFVKRVREVSTINPAALPMGILEHIEIEPVKRMLTLGDIVVMASDGVVDAVRGTDKENWVANFLRRTASERPQEIADKILRQAIELSGGMARDDMAVLVARVAERPGIVQ